MKYFIEKKYGKKSTEKLEIFHSFRESLEAEGLEIINTNDCYFTIKEEELYLYIQNKLGNDTYTINIDECEIDGTIIATNRICEVESLDEIREEIYKQLRKNRMISEEELNEETEDSELPLGITIIQY